MTILETLGGRPHLEQTIGAKNIAPVSYVETDSLTFRFSGCRTTNTLEIVEFAPGIYLAGFWIVPSSGKAPIYVETHRTTLENLKPLFEKQTGLKL